MVLQSSLATLPMTCRGGEHCCARNGVKLCSLDEGDCNSDLDCEGSLVCGDNNCPQSVRTMKGIHFNPEPLQGGLWDPEDDCCTTKCTSSTPCNKENMNMTLQHDIGKVCLERVPAPLTLTAT